LLEAIGAFIKNTKFLIAEGHVMHRKQEYKLIMLILGRLNLLKHRLRFLKKDQSLFETFL